MDRNIGLLSESELRDQESESRKQRARVYQERFAKAEKGLGFHNCAGLVKYLIGLSEKDGFIRSGDSSEKGLISFLQQESILPISDFSDGEWIKLSSTADVVAFLKNDNDRWQYMHFVVPNPDPDRPFEVYHRNGFEEIEAQISDIHELLSDLEYVGDTTLVFMKKK